MANPFDQFDQPAAVVKPTTQGNPFDQFDQSTEHPALREAKVEGSAAARGVASVPATIMDAITSLGDIAPPILRAPTMQTIKDQWNGKSPGVNLPEFKTEAQQIVQRQGTQPKTDGEKYRAAGIEGGMSALAGGGWQAPVRSAITGVASGLGAEAGGHIAPDNPLARVGGGLLGGLVGGGITNLKRILAPNVEDLASKSMRNVSEEDLSRAATLQALAEKQGVKLDLSQALQAATGKGAELAAIRNQLANSEHGLKTQKLLTTQPKEVEILADRTAGGIPGPNWGTNQAANNAQEASTKFMDKLKLQRSGDVQADYKRAGNIEESSRDLLIKEMQAKIDRPGQTDGAKSAAQSIISKITPEVTGDENLRLAKRALAAAEDPSSRAKARAMVANALAEKEAAVRTPLHALDVDTAISDAIGPFKGSPMSPPDPKTLGQVKDIGKTANRILQEASPAVRTAEQKYARISEEVVNPAKQSITGQIATRSGYKPDVQASAAKLEAIFLKGSDDAVAPSMRDINRFAADVKGIDKDVFPAVAKAFIRDRVNKVIASKPEGTDQPNPDTAKLLHEALFKTRSQMQGMRDTGAAIARAYDLKEPEVVRGIENLASITKAASNRPGSVSGLSQQEVAEGAGKNITSDVLATSAIAPGRRLAWRLQDALAGNTLRTFDELMTSPEGAKTLAELGKVPVMSGKAQTILSTFFGTATNVNEPL